MNLFDILFEILIKKNKGKKKKKKKSKSYFII